MYSAIKIKINKSKSWLINKFTKQKKKLQPNFTFKPFQFSSIAKFIEYPNTQKWLQFEFRNRFWHGSKRQGIHQILINHIHKDLKILQNYKIIKWGRVLTLCMKHISKHVPSKKYQRKHIHTNDKLKYKSKKIQHIINKLLGCD